MITHSTHRYTSHEALETFLSDPTLLDAVSSSSSVLVQIFSADTNPQHLQAVSALVSRRQPTATVVGATTVGEVSEGYSLTGCTVIGFTCFESSTLSAIAMPCQDPHAGQVGAKLGRRISQCPGKVVGVLLLATPLSIDACALLQGLESTASGFPIFGWGAGDYAAMTHSLVFFGDRQYSHGAVAVVLAGDDLHIESKTYLGLRPLSKSMQVTGVDQLLVKTVDGKPAFDVYRRYLNIANDETFYLNALEFPFLLERDGGPLSSGTATGWKPIKRPCGPHPIPPHTFNSICATKCRTWNSCLACSPRAAPPLFKLGSMRSPPVSMPAGLPFCMSG